MSASLLLFLSAIFLANGLIYQPRTAMKHQDAFEEYNTFWNKTHANKEEKTQRFLIFKEASKKIAKLNAGSKTATFGYTKFADLSSDEFKTMLGFVPSEPLDDTVTILKRDTIPSGSIDWVAKGVTTPIKNQGQCGSCWAFSATETVESANLLAGKGSVPHGSEQEIVDCDANDDGCNGGDPREALRWVVQQRGLDTESCYPYTAQDGNCQSSSCTPNPSLQISRVVPIAGSETAIYQALTQSPLSICCDAEPWQYYNGGILTADQCGLSIDHAIQLTGYSASQGGYWIVRNSWGADWGENGFIYLQYGQNTCGITSRVTAAFC
jgi:C1A family cysteine protease